MSEYGDRGGSGPLSDASAGSWGKSFSAAIFNM